MVAGLESFREWFSGYNEQYIIIGGTACDLLMGEEGFDFRATHDIDMVLILECLTPEFGKRFWEYVHTAGYEHKNKSSGEPQFYRFSHPKSKEYPAMIELFSKRNEAMKLPENAVLAPMPLAEELSSLSAILMNEEYYHFMLGGRIMLDGISVLDAGHLIPFKTKAYLDLSERKAKGEMIDSKDIRKHRNDVIRLSVLLTGETKIIVPNEIYNDLAAFIEEMEGMRLDVKQIGIRNQSPKDVFSKIKNTYEIQ